MVDLDVSVVMNKGVVRKHAHIAFGLFYEICVEANVTDRKTYIVGNIRKEEGHDLKEGMVDRRIDDP